MVVFSILLMIVVLFYNKGIMGNKEFSWDRIADWCRRIKGKFSKVQSKGGSIDG